MMGHRRTTVKDSDVQRQASFFVERLRDAGWEPPFSGWANVIVDEDGDYRLGYVPTSGGTIQYVIPLHDEESQAKPGYIADSRREAYRYLIGMVRGLKIANMVTAVNA